MPFREADGLRFFQFESLTSHELEHAILTRRGGVSPKPWDSLNYGRMVGDSDHRVTENIERGLGVIGYSRDRSFDVWQVHSAAVARADGPNLAGSHLKADAIMTNQPGVSLMMRFADCVPIMIHDPANHVIGIAHAGWLGTVRGVATALVRRMKQEYGSKPNELLAGIGPSIGPDHYPVGPEVISQYVDLFGESASDHYELVGEQTHLNLWSANEALLHSEGIRSIEVSGICTACNLQDWYSHRGEHGTTGRFGAHIALRS